MQLGCSRQGFESPLGVLTINKQSGLYYAWLMLWKTATSVTLPNPKFYEAEEKAFISFATMWMQPRLPIPHLTFPNYNLSFQGPLIFINFQYLQNTILTILWHVQWYAHNSSVACMNYAFHTYWHTKMKGRRIRKHSKLLISVTCKDYKMSLDAADKHHGFCSRHCNSPEYWCMYFQ